MYYDGVFCARREKVTVCGEWQPKEILIDTQRGLFREVRGPNHEV
jgi:hypothetical protein